MSQVENLIIDHLDTWTQAIETRSSAGRGSNNKLNLVGIKKLRELILEMAVRGLLVPQDPSDEPASVLLKKIAAEKAQLIKDKKIKKSKPLPEITEAEKPFDLPNGWEWTANINLFLLTKGKKPKNISETRGKYPYLDIEALDRNNILRHTDDESALKCSIKDLLVVCDGSRSGLILDGKDGVIGSTLARIDTLNFLKPFIKLFFQNSFLHLNANLKGAAIPHLDTKALRSGFMAFPPLEEQKRIVAKVDELMALCDQLEGQTLDSIATHQTLVETLLGNLVNPENTDKFKDAWSLIAQNFDVLFTTEKSIDTLKQTILQLAVMGKLVPQNPSDEPASKLLEKIAAEKAQLIADKKIKKSKPLPEITEEEKPFELPNSWEWCRMKEIFNFLNGYAFKSSSFLKNSSGVKLLRNLNIGHGETKWDEVVSLPVEQADEFERFNLEIGDVVISLDRPIINTGLKYAVIKENDLPCLLLQRVAKFNSYGNMINSAYLTLWLKSDEFINSIDPGRSNGVPHISTTQLESGLFSLPPVQEQNCIVDKVNELMTLCDQLKTQLQTAQQTQNCLAQSISQEAFS